MKNGNTWREQIIQYPKVNPQLWKEMSTHERLCTLSSRSLDDCLAVLEEPLDYTNAILINAKVSVIRAVLATCTKLGIEASRSLGEREKILADMARDLRAIERREPRQ